MDSKLEFQARSYGYLPVSFPVIHPHMHVFTDDEVRQAFDAGIPIYFDTMVFRNLWKLHSNPRKNLLGSIRDLASRVYLPHQVQVELYRQAYSDAVLNNVPTPGLFEGRGGLDRVREYVLSEIGKVRPQSRVDAVTAEQIEALESEVQIKFDELVTWLDEVDDKVRGWLGDRVDITAIKRGGVPHLLLDEIAEVFDNGHLLAAPGEEQLNEWKALYVSRVNQDDPVGPGKTDSNKASVDEAAGDYYVWQEILAHCKQQNFTSGFVFVTEERKPDIWEVQQGEKALRRIDPRIQDETIKSVGGPMYVLNWDEFLGHAVSDEGTREILSNISQDVKVSNSSWSDTAYAELLVILNERGHERQRDVIVGAARAGGYLARAEIGRILGWGDANKYLTRFRMPADRAKAELVDRAQISQDAPDPLWAVYDGPGEAIGYAVPDIFTEFQLELDGDGA
ncbi:PIN-like domain-containing protein [Microbacterium testaceum]|uniref:PIN-like domain-containing protein n=1 Tax=Microbacterium testaceum TaxID=2033 RepID=UPI0011AF1450|nr:PIN-like domain-containing protein [Microbacterium testaceum]